jgi:hypothetical protein
MMANIQANDCAGNDPASGLSARDAHSVVHGLAIDPDSNSIPLRKQVWLPETSEFVQQLQQLTQSPDGVGRREGQIAGFTRSARTLPRPHSPPRREAGPDQIQDLKSGFNLK